jgi:Fic family protein
MNLSLKLISVNLFPSYQQQVNNDLQVAFRALKEAEVSNGSFSFYTSVSAIASSRIEGEQLEVDSYLKYKMLDIEYQPNLVQKPNDLYNAYLFAQQNDLNEANFLEAHRQINTHLLPVSQQGKLRTGNMVVMEHQTGRIQFEAAPGQMVRELNQQLWDDIQLLKEQQLSHAEAFYFAAYIHLVFVNIHPFQDGNGRAARVLEKWFLAQILGPKAWFLQSELNYYQQVNQYYKNLNCLGIFYNELDYTKALPFLLMLPDALRALKQPPVF